MKKLSLLIVSIMSLSWPLYGQKKDSFINKDQCGTPYVMKQMDIRGEHNDTKFEKWLSEKIAVRRNTRRRGGPYKVPVIVHVIHSGQPPGTGTNISTAQIESQIAVLNADMKRLNLDANNTRDEEGARFAAIAGSLDITFEPATSDPNGLPLAEPGIHRVNGNIRFNKTVWNINDCNQLLKPQTIWNPTEYLNIWVVDLINNDPRDGVLLGFAQFPEIPQNVNLEGIDPTRGFATDGVVINYRAFGSNIDPVTGNAVLPAYNLFSAADRGRTLTHEVGHWLGLRHIWGDVDTGAPLAERCDQSDGGDYVDDTPIAGEPSRNCSSNKNTCGVGTPGDQKDMIENYMDYTPDQCMNMFTKAQVERMITVLESSPRRKELLSSTKAAPINLNAPIAAFRIISPVPDALNIALGCAPVTVSFEDLSLNGQGSPAINSWEWNFDATSIGGISNASFSGKTPPEIVYTKPGEYEIRLTVSNGSTTATIKRNLRVITSDPMTANPIEEGFETSTTGWSFNYFIESDGWYRSPEGRNSNTSIFAPNYFVDMAGRNADFYSPLFDFQYLEKLIIEFDVAYTYYTESGSDTYDDLEILIATECGKTFTSVWRKNGAELATRPGGSENEFVPRNESEWRRETVEIDAQDFLSIIQKNAYVVFRNIGRFGNNIYLDNIRIGRTLSLEGLVSGLESSTKNIKIYPNPAIDILNLSTDKPILLKSVSFKDVLGQEWQVPVTRNNENTTFDVRSLPKGLYIVSIQTPSSNFQQKIVVE